VPEYRYSLSIVVPCFNEAVRLQAMFDLIRKHAGLGWQWIFVDDGSSDDTAAQVESLRETCAADVALIRHERNRGKGAAVMTGFRAAGKDLVGYVDADLAACPLQFATHLDDDEIAAGRKLLVGIRLLTEERKVRRTFFRHLIGRLYQTFVSAMTGLTVYDSQCGFKLLSAAKARAIADEMESEGFAFDAELILRAKLRHGMAVEEHPIAWEEKHHSRVRPWHVLHMIWEVHKISRRLSVERSPQAGRKA
jgi:glycosyltransferase involved in cell wall biosynthesis